MLERSKEEEFLLKKFSEFYSHHRVEFPSNVDKREFGTGSFGKKISNRHLAFSSAKEFNEFLVKETPLFVSYSNAYYEFPARSPMHAKHLLEADLVYEFDADDIPSDCKQEHDFWYCEKCGAKGKGAVSNCSSCGSAVKTEQWFCEHCLDKTKQETIRLLEILGNDFGFSENVFVNFSGNAGYHIHLEHEGVRKLSQPARIDLLNYLTLHEIDWQLHGFSVNEDARILSCPRLSKAKGISKRLMLHLISFIKEWSPEKVAGIGNVPKRQIVALLKNKDFLLEKMLQGILLPLPETKGTAPRFETSKSFWFSLLEYSKVSSGIALNVDRQTSIDLHKIVRVPNTLHGGTGLLARNVSLQELSSFNPFEQTIVFSDAPVKVFINNSPKLYLNRQAFGPFNNVEEELPEFAAIYLIAKGKAVLR